MITCLAGSTVIPSHTPPLAMAKSKKGKHNAKGDAPSTSTSKKLKPASKINVRHILCEKLTKADEALARIKASNSSSRSLFETTISPDVQNGERFDTVAKEMSEDKPRGSIH